MLTVRGAATRQRIVEAAAAEIREHGAVATRLEDVGKRSATGKGQMFHYFPDGKEQLLLAVAEFEAGRVLEDQEPHLSALDSWDAWSAWQAAVVDRYRRLGPNCPLGMLLTEVGKHTPAARAITVRLLEAWEAALCRGITTMQAAGEIRPGVDPRETAAALVAAIQGGVVVLMATGRSRHLEAALDVILTSLGAPTRALTA
ncbi:TetR/AcrR family transcriptional regulator [Dactylosporangium sp. McL0621]|uniref:TetR/AcrR family transcriptional regulator n=1 Tax=Dactylosporangium sp. McL0621 TaxID=3415678 RepID=UPI003CFA31B8